jgi:hypothetical protein
VALHKPLYPPFGQMPYLIRVYNPLTYLPAGLAGWFLGLDLRVMLLVGRLVSYLSSLLLGLLLFVWIWRYTGDWKPGVLAAMGIFYFHEAALSEFFRLRPESPALLFTFAGVAAFLSKHRLRIFAAAFLFFIAFLFKQSFIAAPISAGLFLVLSKEYKDALRFSLAMVAMLLLFFLAMYCLTGANYFYHTIVSLAVNDIDMVRMFLIFRRFLIETLYGLMLSLPVALTLLIIQRRCYFLILYFAVSLVWTFFSLGKHGASYNYFGELTILSLVIVAAATVPQTRRSIIGVVVILFLLCFQMYSTILGHHGIRGEEIAAETRDLGPDIERYKTLSGKKLIIEEMIAVYVGDVVGLDWVLLDDLEKKGLIDLSPLYRQITEGEYAICAFGSPFPAPVEGKMLGMVVKGPYRFTRSTGGIMEFRRVEKPPEGD